MTASDLYKAGKLKEAIDAQIQEVRSHAADHSRRLFLFELLVFAGDLDRAKKQIEILNYPEMELMAAVTAFRQLLDSEEARRQLYKNGIAPQFFGEQCDHINLRLEALNRLRQNLQGEAATILAKAQQLTPPLKGKLNDKPFQSLRDCDDVLAGVLEVMIKGNYYWVPLEQIETVQVVAPKFPRDLIWRSAHLELREGAAGNVFLPVLYPLSHEHENDLVKMGRMVDWKGSADGPVLGVGLHMYLAGEDDVNLLTWRELEFEIEAPPAESGEQKAEGGEPQPSGE
jgi:type VI secretion system protein ImpE